MKEVQQAEALRLAEFFESMRKSSHRWYDGTPVHEKAAAELRRQHARIAELEKENSYMNNACAELEAYLEAVGAGGVQPLRKDIVPLSDVLERLAQGFGRESAPVTTIRSHFAKNAAQAKQGGQAK